MKGIAVILAHKKIRLLRALLLALPLLLSTCKTPVRSVVLLLPEGDAPRWQNFAQVFQEEAKARDLELSIYYTSELEKQEQQLELTSKPLLALFFIPEIGETPVELLNTLREQDPALPIVSFWRSSLPDFTPSAVLQADFSALGKAQARQLQQDLPKGKVLIFSYNNDIKEDYQQYQEARKVLLAQVIKGNIEVVLDQEIGPDNSPEELIRRLFRQNDQANLQIDGVLCPDSLCAQSATSALEELQETPPAFISSSGAGPSALAFASQHPQVKLFRFDEEKLCNTAFNYALALRKAQSDKDSTKSSSATTDLSGLQILQTDPYLHVVATLLP